VFQVIRQFEEFSAPDVVISLARNAIAIADDDDENLVSTLNVACLCYHEHVACQIKTSLEIWYLEQNCEEDVN